MILNECDKDLRMQQQEWLILQVTLHIEDLMEKHKVNRTELAKRLGTDKSYITQLLDGTNMTLRKIADVMLALDSSLVVDSSPVGFVTTIESEDTFSPLKVSGWGRPNIRMPDVSAHVAATCNPDEKVA